MKTAVFAVGAAVLAASTAFAALVGQQHGNPCDAVWDVGDARVSGTTLECTDGDPHCDGDGTANGRCAVTLNVCTATTAIEGCTPGPLTRLRVKGGRRLEGFVRPAVGPTAACGTAGTVTLALRSRGKTASTPFRARITTRSAAGRGRSTIVVRCQPDDGRPTSTTTTLHRDCLVLDAPGLPRRMALTTSRTGSDVDLGFSGNAHDFTVPTGARLDYCLDRCDATTDPLCDAIGPTGAGTQNGASFGAPWPILTQSVPLCIVSRFRDTTITGTVDLASGAIESTQRLALDVYLRAGAQFVDLICPRCDDGRCTGGKNPGMACTATARADVVGSTPSTYLLSNDCPPEGDPLMTMDVELALRTGDAVPLGRPTPCRLQVVDDRCGAGSCGAFCTAEPSFGGGIDQTCCSTNPNLPCFPTGEPGGQVSRTGTAVVATPAWPDTTYPKVATGTKLAATFCLGPTGDVTIDGVMGLPGPGAIILPVDTVIEANQ